MQIAIPHSLHCSDVISALQWQCSTCILHCIPLVQFSLPSSVDCIMQYRVQCRLQSWCSCTNQCIAQNSAICSAMQCRQCIALCIAMQCDCAVKCVMNCNACLALECTAVLCLQLVHINERMKHLFNFELKIVSNWQLHNTAASCWFTYDDPIMHSALYYMHAFVSK